MCYVGQTIRSLKRRFKEHCALDKETYISRAIKKYGKENFTIEKVCECSNREELNRMEELFVKKMNSLSPNGYNLTGGGGSGEISQETREKLSLATKGIPKTKEHIRKVTDSILASNPSHYKDMNKSRKYRPLTSKQRSLIAKAKLSKQNFVGVSRDGNSFRTGFSFKGKRYCLTYDSEVAAAHGYDLLCIQHGLDPVNFPNDVWCQGKIDLHKKARRKPKSKFLGVKKTPHGKWMATLCRDSKANYLGTFATENGAREAINAFLISRGEDPIII